MSAAPGAAKAEAPKSHDICHGWADHHPLGKLIVGFFSFAFVILSCVALMRGCSGNSSKDKSGAAATPHQGSASPTVGRGSDGVNTLLAKILNPRSLLRGVSTDPLGKEHYIFIGSFMNGAMEDSDGNAVTTVEGVRLSHRRLWVRVVKPPRRFTEPVLDISPDIWMYQSRFGGPVRDSLKESDWEGRGISEEFEIWLRPDLPYDPQNPPEVTIAWKEGKK